MAFVCARVRIHMGVFECMYVHVRVRVCVRACMRTTCQCAYVLNMCTRMSESVSAQLCAFPACVS